MARTARTMTYAIVGGVAVALVAAVGFYFSRPGEQQAQSTTDTIDTASAAAATDRIANLGETGEVEPDDMVMGSADAPVTIIEYASLTCPHCARFHEDVFPQLREAYIDSGQVRFVFREVYFDQLGLFSGALARCAGEDRYFGMIDLLLGQQGQWARQPNIRDALLEMTKLGLVAGMDEDTMQACLTDEEVLAGMTRTYQRHAERDGINSTPSFIIDGELHGNMSFEDFSRIIDAALDEQS
ncbi:MAG: DsbA family protein [Pseudomonadota bacterium]